MKVPLIETEGQVAAWYHSKILRIEHGKRVHTKRYLTDEQVLAVFDGEVRVEEKMDGKLNVTKVPTYYPEPQEFWVSELIHSKSTVHNHIIHYSKYPHHVWINKILVVDGEPTITDIMGRQNTLGYGTIILREPTLEQIHTLLNTFSQLSSHYGAPKIEGLVLKNMEKQLFAKWVNEEFEDKIEESEQKP